jgi:PEP-CTERM motif
MNRIANLSFRAVLFAAGLAVLAAVATPASAQTASFRVSGESAGVGGPCTTFDATSTNPVFAVGGCLGDPLGSVRGSAGAGFGQLATESRANTNAPGSFARWQTTATFSDFLTFSSSDPTATSAIVSANLLLAGLLTVPVNGIATQSRVAGGVAFGGLQSSFLIQPNLNGADIQLSGLSEVGGTLLGTSGLSFADLRTAQTEVALNTPVFFQLSLQVFALAASPGANTVTDFGSASTPPRTLEAARFASQVQNGFGTLNGNGFGLPIDFDAFQLPAGVTVNSGTWLINNRRVVTGVAAVPEPASWALMIAGFGLIGGARRRSRNRSLAPA